MRQPLFDNRSKQDKVMNEEQFEQIIAAILAGKYSWACLLILRFAGYNPLHYIPYRTYNRLIKDNCRRDRLNKVPEPTVDNEKASLPTELSHTLASSRLLSINDLNYLKDLERQEREISGGFRLTWLLG